MRRIKIVLALFLIAGCVSLRHQPMNAEKWVGTGFFYLLLESYNVAIKVFSKAIEIDPRYAEAYYGRGYAWLKKGEFDRAISNYTKAVEIDPRYAVAYNNRENAWFKKGDLYHALSDAKKALSIEPEKKLHQDRVVFFEGQIRSKKREIEK